MANSIILPAAVENFLKTYSPANAHYTSRDEMNTIIENLMLNMYSREQLRLVRNTVVEFYTNLMDKEIMYDENGEYAGRTDKYFQYLCSMGSVTSTIDHYSYSF